MLEYRTMIGMLSQKSNEPTKTKKAMKQTMKYLSIAALVVVGANMMSCNKVELSTEQLQEDKTTSNVVTLTTTVGLDGGATTRALTSGGVKTFAAGETIALVYKKTGGATAVAVSEALKDDGDIASGAKSATFTFTLEDPDNTQNVTYVYPAAMAKADGSINYDALDAQDGTLASLASNLDLATYTAAWNGTALPNVTLDNQLAILAITLKDNAATPSEITGDITGMTVSDGTNTYTVTRSAAAGPIYVAIQPTSSANIGVTATDGTTNYFKELTSKSYSANNGYSVSWRMTQGTLLSLVSSNYVAKNGDVLKGTLGANVKISIANGATVTLDGVSINASGTWTSGNYAGINCAGDATIILNGENSVKGFNYQYPGIYVPSGKTLTIDGTGSLNASTNGSAAGIGGYNHADNDGNCGNIIIKGGTITATGGENGPGIGCGFRGTCDGITIEGGTVNATGGENGAGIGSGLYGTCNGITIKGGTVNATGGEDGAGIGSGYVGSCGDITITSGVTSVTATKGNDNAESIGAGRAGSCGTVNIEDPSKVTQN